jgi:hypothetical protein
MPGGGSDLSALPSTSRSPDYTTAPENSTQFAWFLVSDSWASSRVFTPNRKTRPGVARQPAGGNDVYTCYESVENADIAGWLVWKTCADYVAHSLRELYFF